MIKNVVKSYNSVSSAINNFFIFRYYEFITLEYYLYPVLLQLVEHKVIVVLILSFI